MDNINKRKAVLAMEYLVCCVNDETVMEPWLLCGVADGDIDFGSFDLSQVDDYYVEKENFDELVELFLKIMSNARKSGGLYIPKDFGGEYEI